MNLGSFRILLPFFWTSWGFGDLNSAIFNSFHKSGWVWYDFGGPSEFRGGLTPQTPPRYATGDSTGVMATPLRQALARHCSARHCWGNYRRFFAAPRLCVFTGAFVQNLTSKLQYDINKHVSGNCFVLHADTHERYAERKERLSSCTKCDVCGVLWVSV